MNQLLKLPINGYKINKQYNTVTVGFIQQTKIVLIPAQHRLNLGQLKKVDELSV